MQLGSNPEQKVVSPVNRTAVALRNVFPLDQLGGTHHPVSKTTARLPVMVIPHTAAAVIHVGPLHEGRADVFPMTFLLIFQPPLEVTIDLTANAALEKIAA